MRQILFALAQICKWLNKVRFGLMSLIRKPQPPIVLGFCSCLVSLHSLIVSINGYWHPSMCRRPVGNSSTLLAHELFTERTAEFAHLRGNGHLPQRCSVVRYRVPTLHSLISHQYPALSAIASAICDATITTSIIYYLRPARTGINRYVRPSPCRPWVSSDPW